MSVSLDDILRNSIFDGFSILAGREGLNRLVHRVSVFDCPYHENILSGGIIEPGDLFPSCLEQFQEEDVNLQLFVEGLIRYGSAGLLVVPTGQVSVLSQNILNYCDAAHFPVILIKDSIPYAKIMNVVNKYTFVDMMNALNQLKVDKIRSGNISDIEKRETLHSINPRFREYIRSIYVDGTFHSHLSSLSLTDHYTEVDCDTLIMGKPMIVLLSSDSVKALKQHTNIVSCEMKQYFSEYYLGFSRIHTHQEISQVFQEGERALNIALALKVTQKEYDPLSSLQMLLAVQGSQEEKDFYNSYVHAIADAVSGDALPEFLRTVEVFVANSGNYKMTAEQLHQHENTVRYRIHRVKQALGMEEDTIRFYETISLAVQLRIVLGKDFIHISE